MTEVSQPATDLQAVIARSKRLDSTGSSSCWLWTLAACCLLPTAHAETKVGFRQLGSTTPVAVQRGTTAEINIRSNYTLDGAYRVLFDRPGITAEFLETEPIDAPRKGRGRPGFPFRFNVTVPEDQPLGVYEMRVATKTAVSSVTHLMVTDLPVVAEADKAENGTPDAAQPIAVNTAIAGTCEKSEDVDCYRITAKAGQTITFEVFAQRVTEAVHSMQSGNGTYLMDSILTLMTSTGQVLTQNDNHIGGDAFIAYTVPSDGEYVVSIRDARYIGNTKYVYCLQISDRPYAHTVFPLAVQRGQQQDVEVVGHNLGSSTSATIDTTSENESIGWRTLPLQVAAGQTNPVSVLVSEHPQIVAPDGSHEKGSATRLTFPVGITGRLTEPDQVHRFVFSARAGDFIRFDVTSAAIGLPLDVVLQIRDAAGKSLIETDDILNTKDPQWHFKAPADGEYTLLVRDLHDRGGERFLYHLSAVPSGPDFELYGEYYYSQLAPGTRMAWFANIIRRNGFTGPVAIEVEGLPAGVTQEPVSIPEGMNDCLINLVADDAAPIGASVVKIVGRATVVGADGKTAEIKRDGRITCELQTQGGGQARWPINTSLVGVVEPLDLQKVTAEPTDITLKRGSRTEFTVKIVRSKDFKEPVTLDMAFTYFSTTYGSQLPPGVTLAKGSSGRLAGDTLEGKIILEATDKAVLVERLPIAAVARVPITFSITTNYASNPVYLTVTDP